ncbi:MAG: GDP-mannose 4,6-dehydratase [bacterium]|jgi:GDP-4-dehydro-6-deoxy-D-mannose reductase|nr:GDP-mannose 4,6-dehydratase [bacterium]MDD4153069.1 GDP-mannose 4,6-dehydratase [bacterium]MDD4558915.1 GDP-mannose 4,6-dehydratase [bacterium]
MNILITGIAGFVGSHLAELLIENPDNKVYGICHPNDGLANLECLMNRVELLTGDITDSRMMAAAFDSILPERVYHLAAQSFVPLSFKDPYLTMDVNIKGTLNILEAARKMGKTPSLLLCGTGEEYGIVDRQELPVSETSPFRPGNPYAVSKVAQDMLGYQYYRSYGMRIIRTRAFNHTGPRQDDRFVCSGFARQVSEIAEGRRAPLIETGNLEAERDFTDVRDVVRAYYLLLEKGVSGEAYNVCSGRAVGIKQILIRLLELAGVEADIRIDMERFRPVDMPIIYGDNGKCREHIGWMPKIPLDKTLADLLAYWNSYLQRL